MSRAKFRHVTVLLSRDSGGARRGEQDIAAIAAAFADAGMRARVALIDGADFAAKAKEAVEASAKLVVVAGGDGSVSAAAGELADSDTVLGILPMGTLNHFARDLGIPTDLTEAVQMIVSGKPSRVDLAELNGRAFINNSAIGLYPLMVIDRDAQRRRLGRSKKLALLVASARTLARFKHQRLTLTVNDEKARVETPLLFVGNNDYRLDLPAAGRRETLSDGKLCVLVMRKKTRTSFIAALIRALLGRIRDDDMVRLDDVERLRVDSHRSSHTISLDGEVVQLAPPLDYRIRKGALKVIAPPR